MNTNTGEILELSEALKISDEKYNGDIAGNFKEICDKDMTDVQKINKRVSLKDHRSTLGKQLTQALKAKKGKIKAKRLQK